MSAPTETEQFPPSPEVQREMALQRIGFFQWANESYRQLVGLIYQHPSNERLANLQDVRRQVANSCKPLVESDFFKGIDPDLVDVAVGTLIGEIEQNNDLASVLAGSVDDNNRFDDEFQEKIVERVLTTELEDDEDGDEPTPYVIASPFEQLSTRQLIGFVGALHEISVDEIFDNLETSEGVVVGLEKEYERRERIRTVVIGLVAFAGALGGSLVGNRARRK